MKRRPAKRAGFRPFAWAAAALALSGTGVGPRAALAITAPPTPTPAPYTAGVPERTPGPTDKQLPLGSSVFLVLDQTITSRGQSNTIVNAHLRDPIVLNGTTVAAAGTPVQFVVVDVRRAQMGNVDGWVQIDVKSLPLADGGQLPLHLPHSHIDRFVSVGQASTQDIKDTVGDIFVPYHYLYHVLRKGSDVTLGPGTLIRARTSASVSVNGKTVVMTTPPPLPSSADTPHPDFVPAPMYTPRGFVPPTPRPTPSPTPSATP